MRSTDKNEASSRSHLLFAVNFTHTRDDGSTVEGKMMFVDLAGSERLAQLGYSLYLYEEAVFINESLQLLGRIIWRLSKGQEPDEIDYNGNILTSLLRDTLGGKAKTTIFVCISPSQMDIEATRDTFRFAQSTGKIKARKDHIDASQLEQKEEAEKEEAKPVENSVNPMFKRNLYKPEAAVKNEIYEYEDSVYEGQTLNGFANGKGVETFKDGSIFKGMFLEGYMLKGKHTLPDGSYYQGDYRSNKYQGKGKAFFY